MLRTNRLVLEELSYGDCEFIYELVNEPSFKRYIGDKGVGSLDDAHAYLRDGPIAQYNNQGYGLYRVSLRDKSVAVGICGLVKRETISAPDLGFAFLRAHWSQGYATEAALAVLEHSRKALAIPRIVALVDAGNARSTRLLEHLGFSYERMVRLPGETADVCPYVLAD